MGFDQPVHWVIIAIAATLLFGGYKKMPEMARSAGRSLRIFKTEMKGMADDDDARSSASHQGETGPSAQVPVTQLTAEVPATVPTVPTAIVPPVPVAAPGPVAPAAAQVAPGSAADPTAAPKV